MCDKDFFSSFAISLPSEDEPINTDGLREIPVIREIRVYSPVIRRKVQLDDCKRPGRGRQKHALPLDCLMTERSFS